MWYLLKDSDGKKSVSYTMMLVSFVICTLWLLLSTFEKIGGWDVREFSAETASFWFGPICMLYFGRKWQGSQGIARSTGQSINPPPPESQSGSASTPPVE